MKHTFWFLRQWPLFQVTVRWVTMTLRLRQHLPVPHWGTFEKDQDLAGQERKLAVQAQTDFKAATHWQTLSWTVKLWVNQEKNKSEWTLDFFKSILCQIGIAASGKVWPIPVLGSCQLSGSRWLWWNHCLEMKWAVPEFQAGSSWGSTLPA